MGVGHFVDDIVGVSQSNDAGLFGREHVFPARPQRIHAFGQMFVEPFDEKGIVTLGIVNTQMNVIRQGDHKQNIDAMDLRGLSQAIDEGTVQGRIRTPQELPLGTAAADPVGPIGQNLTGKGHGSAGVGVGARKLRLVRQKAEKINLGAGNTGRNQPGRGGK